MSPFRSGLKRLLPLAVSVLALGFLATRVDGAAGIASLTPRVAWILGPALVLWAAGSLALEALSLVRVTPRGVGQIDLMTAARVKSASYLLGIVNYGLGAAALTVLLRRRAGLGIGEAASAVLLISGMDALALLGLAGVSLLLLQLESTGSALLVITGALVITAAGLTVLRFPGALGPLDRIRALSIFKAVRATPLPRLFELFALPRREARRGEQSG